MAGESVDIALRPRRTLGGLAVGVADANVEDRLGVLRPLVRAVVGVIEMPLLCDDLLPKGRPGFRLKTGA